MMADQAIAKQLPAGSAFLFAGLTVSLLGFLGYYTQKGFVSPPPVVTVSLQSLLLLAGLYTLRSGIAARVGFLWPILAFSLWAFITSIFADDIVALRRAAIILLPGALTCLLATLDPNPHQTFVRFTRILTTISVFSAGFAIVLTLLGVGTISSGEYILQLWGDPAAPGMQVSWRKIEAISMELQRPSGLTSNANSLGIIAALAMTCEIIRCMTIQKTSSKDSILILLLTFISASTFSRGALLFLAIVIAFLVAHKAGKPKWLAAPLVALIAVTPAIFFLFMAFGLIDTPTIKALNSAAPYETGSIAHLYEAFHLRERATIWAHAYNAISEFWLFGAGFSLVQEKVFSPLGMQTAAHSVPLSILIETGIIGLALMLITWFLPVVRAIFSHNTSPLSIGIAAILVGLYGHQIFDSSVFRYHFLHFIFCYLLGAISNPALTRDDRNSYGT
jgi:O-antigen ligase